MRSIFVGTSRHAERCPSRPRAGFPVRQKVRNIRPRAEKIDLLVELADFDRSRTAVAGDDGRASLRDENWRSRGVRRSTIWASLWVVQVDESGGDD